jgi:hypothetical protein
MDDAAWKYLARFSSKVRISIAQKNGTGWFPACRLLSTEVKEPPDVKQSVELL